MWRKAGFRNAKRKTDGAADEAVGYLCRIVVDDRRDRRQRRVSAQRADAACRSGDGSARRTHFPCAPALRGRRDGPSAAVDRGTEVRRNARFLRTVPPREAPLRCCRSGRGQSRNYPLRRRSPYGLSLFPYPVVVGPCPAQGGCRRSRHGQQPLLRRRRAGYRRDARRARRCGSAPHGNVRRLVAARCRPPAAARGERHPLRAVQLYLWHQRSASAYGHDGQPNRYDGHRPRSGGRRPRCGRLRYRLRALGQRVRTPA